MSQNQLSRNATCSRLILMLFALFMAGCLTRTEILYSRQSRLPVELRGQIRLAEKSVRVNVIGSDKIGEFATVDPGGYVLIHERDLLLLLETAESYNKD